MNDTCKNCGWPAQACTCDEDRDEYVREAHEAFVRHLESTPVDDSVLAACSQSDAATEPK
jgi:hypothetical protein